MAVHNTKEGIQLVKEREGFNLTKSISSSQAVMESIKPERRAKVFAQVELGDVSKERVLGMKWNVLDDNFHFNGRFQKDHQQEEVFWQLQILFLIPLFWYAL